MQMMLKKNIKLKFVQKKQKVLKQKIYKLTQDDIDMLKQSEKEFAEGKGVLAEIVFKELEEKYEY